MSGLYRLVITGTVAAEIGSERDLQQRLSAINSLSDGAVVSLQKSDRDYISARHVGGLWEGRRRRGGWWSTQTFSAFLSNEWSERTARKGIGLFGLFSSREQMRFSTEQMIKLFVAHFSATAYPYGYLGAG